MELPCLAETATESKAFAPSASVEEWSTSLADPVRNARKESGRRERATEAPAAALVITIGKKEAKEDSMEEAKDSIKEVSTKEDKDSTKEDRASIKADSTREDKDLVGDKDSTRADSVVRASGDDA